MYLCTPYQKMRHNQIPIKTMKKTLICAFLAAASLSLSSCGSLGSMGQKSSSATTAQDGSGTSLLQNALSKLLGNSDKLTKADLIGTWKYSKPDCRFEDENLLKKAGGEVAAREVESKLSETFAKYGFTGSSVSVTFEESGNCQLTAAGHSMPMKYTLDEENRLVTFTGALGLTNFSATVCKSGSNKLSLLLDGDKLLSLVSLVGSYSNSTTVKTLSSLLGSYDGMKVGMELSK